jgi:hypothetical protein
MSSPRARFAARLATALAASALAACGGAYSTTPLYAGPELPDTQTAALGPGLSFAHDGQPWVALLVGVDRTPCDPQALATETGPTPQRFCGNVVVLRPGRHELVFVMQSANRVTSPAVYSAGSNEWDRSGEIVVRDVDLAAGTVYGPTPSYGPQGWRIDVVEQCRSSDHRASVMALVTGHACR